jgi:sec-independent protein translocase protein TatB
MFDIGWSELVVIGIVALIVIGPKELPGVLRMLGQWMTRIRRMAAEFQGQFNEAMREAEMADLKKQVEQISDSARDLTNFDPIETARREMEGTLHDKPKTADPAPSATEPDASADVGDARAAALAAPAASLPSEVETIAGPSNAPEPPTAPGSAGRPA